MNCPQTPFVCKSSGRDMSFTYEDHLMVHSRKHDMILNLGPGIKTNLFVADQTPTPTRFIRNCEEVGLFQDLQNVNPFEETFRRAVDLAKSGSEALITSHLPGNASVVDDTLHTPHVFPNLDGFITKDILNKSVLQDEKSRDNVKISKKRNTKLSSVEKKIITESIKKKFQKIISKTIVSETSNIQKTKPLCNAEVENSQFLKNYQSKSRPLYCDPLKNSRTKYEMKLLIKLSDGSQMFLPVDSNNVPTVVKPKIKIAFPPSLRTKYDANEAETLHMKEKLKSILKNKHKINVQVEVKAEKIQQSNNAQDLKSKRIISFKKDLNIIHENEKSSEPPVAALNYAKNESLTIEQKGQSKARNRAAAHRWRLKRKKEQAETIKRYQSLELDNAKLKSENTQLKILLLAHKECSVAKNSALGNRP